MMAKKRFAPALWVGVLLAVGTAISFVAYQTVLQGKRHDAPLPVETQVLPESKPPDLAMLAQMANSGLPPTPEQIEEQQRLQTAQVEHAALWLHDADVDKRREGALQMGAYPTPAAERELVEALYQDTEAVVRATAANTLSGFDKPSQESWDAMLDGVSDSSPQVQMAALATLENWLTRPENLQRVAPFRDAFKREAASAGLTAEIRDYLNYLVERLEPLERSEEAASPET